MERDDFQREAAKLAKSSGESLEKTANDDLRPLTADGEKKMKKNAKGLARVAAEPDLLVTSPLVRAKQTFEILRGEWGKASTATCDALRPGTAPSAFAAWLSEHGIGLRGHHSKTIVSVVGHEPHLSTLIAWCLEGVSPKAFELKKGGACLIDFEDGVFGKAKGRLMWSLTPSILRKL